MATRGKGYSTLFRELGTPEGDFHATFAATNQKYRTKLRALGAEYPDDQHIQRFVMELEEARMALWGAWKRGGLSAEMRKIVDEVRIAHHGPDVMKFLDSEE